MLKEHNMTTLRKNVSTTNLYLSRINNQITSHLCFLFTERLKAGSGPVCLLTRNISLKPLRTSRTTFLICGTSLKIRSGRRQRSIMRSWAPDSGGTLFGSQHKKIRLTYRVGRKITLKGTALPWFQILNVKSLTADDFAMAHLYCFININAINIPYEIVSIGSVGCSIKCKQCLCETIWILLKWVNRMKLMWLGHLSKVLFRVIKKGSSEPH